MIFHCVAQEDANGHESVNAATAKASNAEEKSDDAEVYVNSGEFWIEKNADHYEWQVGELVQYNVVVENKKEGTVARKVTIWDTEMPAGLASDWYKRRMCGRRMWRMYSDSRWKSSDFLPCSDWVCRRKKSRHHRRVKDYENRT